MDQRQTFNNSTELKTILSNLHLSGATVSLLLDREGLTRMNGIITAIDDGNKSSGDACFTLTSKNEDIVFLHEVIAINGIFCSDYTEC